MNDTVFTVVFGRAGTAVTDWVTWALVDFAGDSGPVDFTDAFVVLPAGVFDATHAMAGGEASSAPIAQRMTLSNLCTGLAAPPLITHTAILLAMCVGDTSGALIRPGARALQTSAVAPSNIDITGGPSIPKLADTVLPVEYGVRYAFRAAGWAIARLTKGRAR
jgi:hypothetical protein